MKTPLKILLIQTGFIGDVVLSTSLVKALASHYPKAEIDLVLNPGTVDLLKSDPRIHHIHTLDKRNGIIRKLTSMVKVVHTLRKRQYDLAFSVHVSFTTSLILLLSRSRVRIGYPRQKFTTISVPFPPGYPIYARSLLLLEAITGSEIQAETELYIPNTVILAIKTFISSQGLDTSKLITVAPGSVWATKRWLPEYYSRLLLMLDKAGWQLALIGSASEHSLCETIIKDAGVKTVNCAGSFDLLGSAELIRRSRLLICNDSGTMHIANAVDTPVLVILGPTKTPGFLPYRPHDELAEIEIECRPCGSHGAKKCPQGHFRCMRELKPEQVFALATELLSEISSNAEALLTSSD
jgi:heptosyltransferase II